MGKGGRDGLGWSRKWRWGWFFPSVKLPEYRVSRVNTSFGHWGGLGFNVPICQMRELDWPTQALPGQGGVSGRVHPHSSMSNLELGRVGSSWSSSGAKGNILL